MKINLQLLREWALRHHREVNVSIAHMTVAAAHVYLHLWHFGGNLCQILLAEELHRLVVALERKRNVVSARNSLI